MMRIGMSHPVLGVGLVFLSLGIIDSSSETAACEPNLFSLNYVVRVLVSAIEESQFMLLLAGLLGLC